MFFSWDLLLLSVSLILLSNAIFNWLKRGNSSLSMISRIIQGFLGVLALVGFLFPDYELLPLEYRIVIVFIGIVGVIIIQLKFNELKNFILSKISINKNIDDLHVTKKSNYSSLEKIRKDIPFDEFLQNAKQEIIFVVITNELVTRFKIEELKKVIYNGVKITIILLNPNSEDVKHKDYLFKTNDLKENIEKQLGNLCKLKTELRNMGDKLVIKTFDSRIDYSYIVIDPYSENSIMKIENLNHIDPEKRKNELAYKNGKNSFLYNQHNEIIDSLENDEYFCN